MRCLNPIMMYDTGKLTEKGKRCLTAKANPRLPFEQPAIPVPCGKCSACRLARLNEWVSRLRLESLASEESSFVTLTYKDNPNELIKTHVQNFIKRLRNANRDYGVSIGHIRYLVSGEFGLKHHRPHWHGIIYGVDFLSPAWQPWLVMYKDGFPIYTSNLLTKIWGFGHVTVDRVTPQSCRYVAKYILKDGSVSLKSQGLGRSPLVSAVRRGRHTTYSLRPLLLRSLANGFLYLPQCGYDFSPVGIPKGFDRYLERCDSSLFEQIKKRRADFVRKLPFDSYAVGESAYVSSFNYSLSQKKGILDNES